jgi:hypothetical protein
LAFVGVGDLSVGWPCDGGEVWPKVFVFVRNSMLLDSCATRNVAVDVARL